MDIIVAIRQFVASLGIGAGLIVAALLILSAVIQSK
jgi:hypothetical protein